MRWLIRTVVIFAVVIGGFVALERMFVYPLDPRQVSPAEAGIPRLTELKIKSAQGRDLILWHAKARNDKPTILYLHGNAGNLANRAFRFQSFLDRGYGVLAPAYRGSSGSTGWPYQGGIESDTRDIYRQLVSGDLTGEPTRPIIYGESIGAAVTIHLAASVVASDEKGVGPPKAVILEAPFTSIVDVAKAVRPELVFLTGFMLSRWESIKYAPMITSPLLILHGEDDGLIPIDQGRAIFQAASSAQKEFYPVKGAGHINVWKVDAQKKLYAFLRQF